MDHREIQTRNSSVASEKVKPDFRGREGGQHFSYQRFYSNAEKGQAGKRMCEMESLVLYKAENYTAVSGKLFSSLEN